MLQQVQRSDPERHAAAMLAPASARGPLMALLALGQEAARVPDLVSQPLTGLIRLQWWRDRLQEAAEGRPAEHPILRELTPALQEGRLPLEDLHALLEARERELEGLEINALGELEAHARATSGLLQAMTLRLLAPEPASVEARGLKAAREVGTAYGLIGVPLAAPILAGNGRTLLPQPLLDQAGATLGGLAVPREPQHGWAALFEPVVDAAEATLAGARSYEPPRWAVPALLPSVWVRRHAAKLRHRGFAPYPESATGPGATLELLWRSMLRRP